jgi:hypothetical protein
MEVRKGLWGVTKDFELPGSSLFFACLPANRPIHRELSVSLHERRLPYSCAG